MDSSTIDSQQMGAAGGGANTYRVEVSGWDDHENFFVEKAMLDWSETEGKTIGLRSAVRLESVLFVRLIRPLGGGTGFPVPYRAVKVEQLQPRMAFRETADTLLASDTRVA
jgi:hypothetical protein